MVVRSGTWWWWLAACGSHCCCFFVIEIITGTTPSDWTLLCKARGLCGWREGKDLSCGGAEIPLYSSTYVVLEGFFVCLGYNSL